MNQSKGTIYYQNEPKFTDEEIVEAINEVSEVKVTDIYRMKKKVDNVLTSYPSIYLRSNPLSFLDLLKLAGLDVMSDYTSLALADPSSVKTLSTRLKL